MDRYRRCKNLYTRTLIKRYNICFSYDESSDIYYILKDNLDTK